MKRKLSSKQTFIIVWVTVVLASFFFAVFAPPPPGSTITVLVNARFSPDPFGLNPTFTIKEQLTLNNVSFTDDRLHLTQGAVDYWIEVTTGSNHEIDINKWFSDNVAEFFISSSGNVQIEVGVGTLGEPLYVSGTSVWSYASNIVTFSVTGPATVALFWNNYNWVFYGVYNETTGLLSPTGTNVTAHFNDGTSPITFEVNGTTTQGFVTKPEYFTFDDLTNERQYWLSDSEDSGVIYIFDDATTTYTVVFLDLAGALDDYPFVHAQYYINGTLRTVEKRKVDEEKKIHLNLVNGRKYNLVIIDGSSYTFGDLLLTDVTTIQLTLKGLDFPKETLLVYQYVRIYSTRAFGNPNGNITITYQDTLNMTNEVGLFINYRNGTTNAYNATETASSFVHTWTSALNNTDYRLVANINHSRYGVWTVRQYFPRIFSDPPWGLGFLGTLPFVTSVIVPSLLIIFVAGCFSQINAEVGAFMAVVVAALLTYIGWIPIPAGYLITAFCIAVFMALIVGKRRLQT